MLWKIETKTKVRRSNLVKLVTMESLISTMNAVAHDEKEAEVERQPKQRQGASIAPQQPTMVAEEEQLTNQTESHAENQVETMEQIQGVVRTRSGRQIVRPSRYATVTKVGHSEWELEAEKGELQQLFQVWLR